MRILVTPLDWGLGHAGRCLPIIKELTRCGVEPIIATGGSAWDWFRKELPQTTLLKLPGYRIRYARHNLTVPKLLLQAPYVYKVIRQEQALVKIWVKEMDIKAIISDNRYGCYHPDVYNIFVCHQLAPRLPVFNTILRRSVFRFHRDLMSPFDEIWVPDDPELLLSGDLSTYATKDLSIRYTGILSRFQDVHTVDAGYSHDILNDHRPELLAILSGPEPQRSLLESRLEAQAQNLPFKTWLVQGLPEADTIEVNRQVIKISHLSTMDLCKALQATGVILSRSGYTSLMDYTVLGIRRMILTPTPGQPEQLYLAQLMREKNRAVIQPTSRLDIDSAVQEVQHTAGFGRPYRNDLLQPLVEELLAKIR